MDDIEVFFLCEGCQSAESVATQLAGFISRATRTIDLAIYSFNLCDGVRQIVTGALQERANAGVQIRIAYDAGSQQDQIAEPDADACDMSTPQFVTSTGFPSKAIEGYRALMHDKYIVIDAGTPAARIWTGSVNFTDDSWTLQESNIITLRSQRLAGAYTQDFDELWIDSNITTSGVLDSDQDTLQYKGQPAQVRVDFAPTEGEWIDGAIADMIASAKERVTIAAVVVTSGKIIGALQGLAQRGVPLEGIYDRTQMQGVQYQWKMVPANNWKIGAFQGIVDYGHLAGKKSTPYSPTSKHDFMHNKVMVIDDRVITGSYNFSRHAQQNAENVLIIQSLALADTYRQYIHSLMAKYGSGDDGAGFLPTPSAPQPATTPPETTL